MRVMLAAAMSVLFAANAAAQTPRQFNLECQDVEAGGVLEERVSLELSVDLDRGLSCRHWNDSCRSYPLTVNGRWIDLSYRFDDATGRHWEMSRIYDTQSGWLDQVVREIGSHGTPYGDAVCRVTDYTPFDQSGRVPPSVR